MTGLGENGEVWSGTGTVDYSLTDQLLLRAEVRYDTVHQTGLRPFIGDTTATGTSTAVFDEGNQITGAVEVIYSF